MSGRSQVTMVGTEGQGRARVELEVDSALPSGRVSEVSHGHARTHNLHLTWHNHSQDTSICPCRCLFGRLGPVSQDPG